MTDHSHFHTLVELLQARANSEHSITFIYAADSRQSVSFGEMLQRAKHRLAHFQSKGAVAGSYLLIHSGDNALFIEAFWACLLGGIVAVPVVTGNHHEHRLFHIAQKLNLPFLFIDESTLAKIKRFSAQSGLQEEYSALLARACFTDTVASLESEPVLVDAAPDDVAFIQFSSGSTREPQGVVLSHRNLLCNAGAIINGCEMSTDDRLLSWMPLTHDMGLIGFHLTPLLCNTSHSLISTDVFVRRPGIWLNEAQEMQASILCSPNFGYQHVLKSFNPEKQPRLDLTSVRLLFNGAEPISVSLCQEFMRAMSPFGLDADAMIPVYGLAEASLAVTFPSLQKRFTTLTLDRSCLALGETVKQLSVGGDGVQFVSVGEPVTHVQLLIKDGYGVHCKDNVTGRICIKGANVTRGYFNEPELNAQLIDKEGWLDTGDLGFIHDKQLYITGRVKDIIFVIGMNVYPHDLEELLVQRGLVERGKVAVASQAATDQASERLLVFVVHRAEIVELASLARDIAKTLTKEAGVSVHSVIAVPRIAKTSSGKVRRFHLVSEFVQGSYPGIIQTLPADVSAEWGHGAVSNLGSNTRRQLGADANMALSECVEAAGSDAENPSISHQLLAICNLQVEGVRVGLNDNLFDLGISSLTLAQIHASIEDTWPEQVDITDLFDYPTVADLSAYINTKVEIAS